MRNGESVSVSIPTTSYILIDRDSVSVMHFEFYVRLKKKKSFRSSFLVRAKVSRDLPLITEITNL